MFIPEDLEVIKDPVPFLQIFAELVRTGVLVSEGNPIQKQSMEQYLCSVGQIFTAVGNTDPRINTIGGL